MNIRLLIFTVIDHDQGCHSRIFIKLAYFRVGSGVGKQIFFTLRSAAMATRLACGCISSKVDNAASF
jgi:hypothetical protein